VVGVLASIKTAHFSTVRCGARFAPSWCMKTTQAVRRLSTSILLACVWGCGSSNEETPPAACSTTAQTGCKADQTCESIEGGQTGCFAPITVKGTVVDAADPKKRIAGAHVVARDDNGASIANVAISDANGAYSLVIPAPRNAAGEPLPTKYTLRADAAGYDTFPGGLRVALPLDVRAATGSPPALQNSATTIGLYARSGSAFGSISGKVKADVPGGVLVVAEGAGAHGSGIADKSGAYTIFNVPAGAYEVRGYAAKLDLASASASVNAGAETKGVDLNTSGRALGSVSGTVSIVNAPGGSSTSVVLAVESTFGEALGRGEVPRGLRVGNISGAFTITDVPAGRYVVLAAFENDKLVRDPDTSIGNTATLHIGVEGVPVDAGNFKVTEALAVVRPGAAQVEMAAAPVSFVWADDSSEDRYLVEVFDTFGARIWFDENVPSAKGAGDASVVYGGPPLTSGNYYQFRATSLKGSVPLSRTEDLLGVFIAQ
jgi:hypothetical protein